MKSLSLMVVVLVLSAGSMLCHAEVFKWKDKAGVTRYSDTPPPSNVRLESIDGKRISKTNHQAPLAPVVNTNIATGKIEPTVKEPNSNGDRTDETAAKLRQKNAELEKTNKKEKESQAKLNDENCKAAKSNLASYKQGGRIYKVNEKGERVYMDDAGLKEGADKAQADISEYCKS